MTASAQSIRMSSEATTPAPHAVSDEDLATAVRVLQALATPEAGPSDEYRAPRCKALRKAMNLYLDDLRKQVFHGQGVDKYTRRKENKRTAAARSQQERAIDRAQADKTLMRAERLRMLGELQDEALLTLVPDGAVETGGAGPSGGPARIGLTEPPAAADDKAGAGDGDGDATLAVSAAGNVELSAHRGCYTCKARYRTLHHFYAHLCPSCAELNYAKRQQTAQLSGRVVLVTGARVKIGFHVALKLLRCGASVLATSRFPADTATRFAAQPDAADWSGRLQIFGLDMRDLAAIEQLCAFLIGRGQKLDAIVNNACQTIRRPAAYYAHLLPLELAETRAPPVQALLAAHDACFARQSPPPAALTDEGAAAPPAAAAPAAEPRADRPVALAAAAAPSAAAPSAAVPSALWSQAPLWSASEGVAQPDAGVAANFPLGVTDVNGQQLDTRRTNSWLLKLHEISTPEAAEVLAINTLAPFILNSRLRPLLEASADKPRFIVNVSAMEGKFYRHKSANHPHTNMAKAALNMMTRTCADEMAAEPSRILMNSVDTGWINDEKPLERAREHAETHAFQTPLDEIDAAARILDPILSAVNGTAPPVHGKFLKDYAPCEW